MKIRIRNQALELYGFSSEPVKIFLILLKGKSRGFVILIEKISMKLPHVFEAAKSKILIFFIRYIVGKQSPVDTKKNI
jgi:hypothetical protein